MEEQLISFETAKLAKEKEFNISGINIYENKELLCNVEFKNWNNGTLCILASTQSLLQKWLREKHNFNIHVYAKRVNHNIKWKYNIQPLQIIGNQSCLALDWDSEKLYLSYEKALEIGLQKALKLIK